ncbi:MAG: FAD-dependent monooxygenase [Armatimonadota bacterium]|nr:FAD-dependent monooxygenase [Armatimonadota bacterium]MDR7451143.1 FAD-dependent monooxygenase [Armatimonadota bacterium]MDR7467252.1 FAD-dependent monooxygenase [Armatimonadota bacterium]MDR7494513.1 FAD-dependent monooxygenase [Armatimonadota bacterium]MDR7499910.1 FAD-dependent monooxygenase [Armatimonadota bacterium]
MRDADVLVVGAGPAGSAAAAHLAALGWRVVLVDRALFPRPKPCGDYCNPGAIRLLTDGPETLPVLDGAGAVTSMSVFAQDGSCFRGAFPSGYGALIRREDLDLSLLRRAQRRGVEVVEGFRVDAVTVGDRVAVRQTPSGRTLGARLLIACDGMHSLIARRLGWRRAPAGDRFAIGAYFSGVPGPPAGELHLGPGLYGGVARFGDGTANACLALPRRIFHRRSAEQAFAFGLAGLPVLAETLRGWRRESAFRVAGPLGFSAHPAVADRLLLAGDAAGQVEPLTGQGVSFALRSALFAAEAADRALRSGDCSAAALRRYERQRAAWFGPRIRLLKTVCALALHPRAAPALVRRLAGNQESARRLLGATGDVLDPRAVLSIRFLLGLLLGTDAHPA